MGLLEKALAGTDREHRSEAREGLFARAASARGAPPDLVTPAIREAEKRSERVFPLTEAQIDAFRAELLALKATPDLPLASYARLAASFPIQHLALFLSHGERGFPAASFGILAHGSASLPSSLIDLLSAQRGDLSVELSESVLRCLEAPSNLRLGFAPLVSSVDDRMLGFWLFSDSGLRDSSKYLSDRIADMLSGPPSRCASPMVSDLGAAPPAGYLLSSIGSAAYATALFIELEPIYRALRPSVRGLSREALDAVVLDAARRLLSSTGGALALPAGLACVLGSTAALDAELALFQFRKSLRRSLTLLQAVELPAGRSIVLERSNPDAERDLASFLAE